MTIISPSVFGQHICCAKLLEFLTIHKNRICFGLECFSFFLKNLILTSADSASSHLKLIVRFIVWKTRSFKPQSTYSFGEKVSFFVKKTLRKNSLNTSKKFFSFYYSHILECRPDFKIPSHKSL